MFYSRLRDKVSVVLETLLRTVLTLSLESNGDLPSLRIYGNMGSIPPHLISMPLHKAAKAPHQLLLHLLVLRTMTITHSLEASLLLLLAIVCDPSRFKLTANCLKTLDTIPRPITTRQVIYGRKIVHLTVEGLTCLLRTITFSRRLNKP